MVQSVNTWHYIWQAEHIRYLIQQESEFMLTIKGIQQNLLIRREHFKERVP